MASVLYLLSPLAFLMAAGYVFKGSHAPVDDVLAAIFALIAVCAVGAGAIIQTLEKIKKSIDATDATAQATNRALVRQMPTRTGATGVPFSSQLK